MRRLGAIIVTTFCVSFRGNSGAARSATFKTATRLPMPASGWPRLYAHIAHLEQTLLSLSTDIVDLRHELKEKLSADSVYKLAICGQGQLPRLCRQTTSRR